ncbi:MAG: DUF1697 domain-containing protein [Candidatus Tumulicola sp.]
MSKIDRSQAEVWVALLRGINVGGKHSLPMKQLVEMFAEARCVDVRSYIQSGNVVFTAPLSVVKTLPAVLAKRIEERFGFRAPIIVRSRDEMGRIIRGNPFLKAGLPQTALHVYFLADLPGADAVKRLDPSRSATDVFDVRGREIYLHLPNGMARTKLTNAYFDAQLSTVATARNWATVLKLQAMMNAA